MVITQEPRRTATPVPGVEPATLEDLITRFCARRELAGTTRDYYTIILANFAWYAGAQDWPEVALITREHIRDFLGYVATEKVRWPAGRRPAYRQASPATVYHYAKCVKSLFNWAYAEEYLATNPTERVRVGQPHYREVEPYSDEEVRAFLAVCEDDARLGFRYLGVRNRAIVCLFVASGLRVEELSGIRLSRLDPRLQQVGVTGKGAKARTVPVNGEARKALRSYLRVRPGGGDMLWKTGDGHPMTLHGVKIMVARLKKRAGINEGGGAHRFRHYFATRYLEAGGDINSLRLLLGHARLDMVLRYAKFVNLQKALAEHEQFDPLDRLIHGRGNGARAWR